MRQETAARDPNSISSRIRKLIWSLAIPLCVLAVFILLVFLLYIQVGIEDTRLLIHLYNILLGNLDILHIK